MRRLLSKFVVLMILTVSVCVQAQLPDFTDMVANEGRAVVNINTTQTVRQQAFDPFFEFFGGTPFGMPPQTREYKARSLGSGFIISSDGYVMTNAHVVAKADEITVTLTDKREYKARLIGADARTDVALLKIDADRLPVVRIGNPGALKVGEWVVAIGSPFGFENSVSAGIVSAKGRQLPREDYVPFIQTDVAVNPGNSGGPLFNMNGEVVGINSQIYSQSGGFQGISFAIPIDVANKIANELKAKGKVSRGRIGVYLQEMTKELAQSFGLTSEKGALVSQVEPNGAAAKAGVKSGDVILRVDGELISSSADLPRIIGNARPGSRIGLQVWRGGATQNLTVQVEESQDDGAFASRAPESRSQAPKQETNKAGMLFQNLTDRDLQLLKRSGFSFGVVVLNPGTAGKSGQIQLGDIVVGVNGKTLQNGQQLLNAINNTKKGSAIAFQVIRQGSVMYVGVTM